MLLNVTVYRLVFQFDIRRDMGSILVLGIGYWPMSDLICLAVPDEDWRQCAAIGIM
jgi:hypothetical protein